MKTRATLFLLAVAAVALTACESGTNSGSQYRSGSQSGYGSQGSGTQVGGDSDNQWRQNQNMR